MEEGAQTESQLCTALTEFLDKTGQLGQLAAELQERQTGRGHNDSFSSSSSAGTAGGGRLVHLQPSLHLGLLLEHHLQLGELALGQPDLLRRLLQTVLYRLAGEVGSEEVGSPTQLVVVPLLAGLPPSHTLAPARLTARPLSQHGPLAVRGRLVALGHRVGYVSSTNYRCGGPDCRQDGVGDGWQYVRVFSPVCGQQEEEQVCHRCGARLEEEYSSRDVRRVLPGRLEAGQRSLEVVFPQQELDRLQLGQQLLLVGRLVWPRPAAAALLEVATVEEVETVTLPRLPTLPPPLHALYQDRQQSPWSWVRSLAWLLAGPGAGQGGQFLSLQLGILLSLASPDPLHLLAVASDPLLEDRILRQLVEGGAVELYSGAGSLGVASKRGGAAGQQEASQLESRRNGVLYLGDLATRRPSILEEVVRVIGSGLVGDSGSPTLTASLWATLGKSGLSGRLARTAAYSTEGLMEVFSLVFSSPAGDRGGSADRAQAEHCLAAAPPAPPVPLGMVLHLARAVRHRPTPIPPGPGALLRSYFLASRRVRPRFPQAALQTLSRLAAAHARIALRPAVSLDDAVLACRLVEETVASVSGFSHLGVEPGSASLLDSLHTQLGPEADRRMRQFHTQLERFVVEHIGLEEALPQPVGEVARLGLFSKENLLTSLENDVVFSEE